MKDKLLLLDSAKTPEFTLRTVVISLQGDSPLQLCAFFSDWFHPRGVAAPSTWEEMQLIMVAIQNGCLH